MSQNVEKDGKQEEGSSFKRGLIIAAILICVAILVFAGIGVKSVFAATPFDSDVYNLGQIVIDVDGDNNPDYYVYVTGFLTANRSEDGKVGIFIQAFVNEAVPLQ